MKERALIWLGASRTEVRKFPVRPRRVSGFHLWRLQQGREPDDWKPRPTIGIGVREIRIQTGEERHVIYQAKFAEGIYVLHAFEKRLAKTARRNLEIARERYRMLLHARTALRRFRAVN